MRRLCVASFVVASFTLAPQPAAAEQYVASSKVRLTATFVTSDSTPGALRHDGAARRRPLLFAVRLDAPQTGSPRKLAVEYSDHYRRRAAIHRFASYATLPLFGAEAWVGQSLYNNPTDAKKSLHLAIAAGMGGLLAVNSVTGIMNLVEANKDPTGRGRRLLHGILLLAADAGFLGAALTAPEGEHHRDGGTASTVGDGRRSLHRALAMSSISLTTVGYLIMLFK